MRGRAGAVLRGTGLAILGWTLVVVGLAALILPGPGLLLLVAGLAVLSQQYEWAERRLEPVKQSAFRTARQGVQTWPRIILSALAACVVIGVGVAFGLQPPAPSWWPVGDGWWLPGGWAVGISIIVSGLVALGLLVYSYRRFRGAPVDEPSDTPAESPGPARPDR